MTAVVLEPESRRRALPLAAFRPADAVVGVLLAWWATYFTWGSGGQDRRLLSVALLLLGAAMVTVRPWQRLPLPVVVVLALVGPAAFLVALTAPTGWGGANEAASYLFASQLALLVLGWADDQARRLALLAVLLTASLFEFGKGWVQWWAGGYADKVLVGTFFWHNQTGIFLVMGAAIGLFLLVGSVPAWAPVAWLAVPLCSAGVVFTTSRASQMALAGAYVAAGAAAVLAPQSRVRGLAKVATAGGLSVLVAHALTGPPFFAERVSASVGQGSRHEALSQNGALRLDFWHQAWLIFQRWPLSGAGFHSFAAASQSVDPSGTHVAFAHNGFLELLSDGGVLLALPVCLALILAFVVGARKVVANLRAGEIVQPTALVAFVLLLLHSGIDFDWSYPALMSAAALLGALSVGDLGGPSAPRAFVSRSMMATTVVLLLVAAIVAWHGSILVNLPIKGGS